MLQTTDHSQRCRPFFRKVAGALSIMALLDAPVLLWLFFVSRDWHCLVYTWLVLWFADLMAGIAKTGESFWLLGKLSRRRTNDMRDRRSVSTALQAESQHNHE